MLNIYEDDFHTHVTHSSHSALYVSFFWQDYGESQIRDPNVTCQIQGTSFNRKRKVFSENYFLDPGFLSEYLGGRLPEKSSLYKASWNPTYSGPKMYSDIHFH